MVNYSKLNVQTFKIHFILWNEMKKCVQYSIENEIKKNCQCQPINNCKCIYVLMETNFNQAEIEKRANSKKKNYLEDLDSTMSKYFNDNNKTYPNDLSLLDFTGLICFSRNLLKINPNNSERIVQNSIEKEIKKKENCQCQANSCQCVSNFLQNFHNSFHPKPNQQNLKILQDSLTTLLQNNSNNYPNNLNDLDYQHVLTICKDLLKKNPPKNDWLNLDLKEMFEDLEFRKG